MNRACVNCGRIITFPDIPLPENYTQKCNACGYDNLNGNELESTTSPPTKPLSVDDSWSTTFDSAVDQVFPKAEKKDMQSFQKSPLSMKASSVSTEQLEAAINQIRQEMSDLYNQKIRSLEARLNNEASITREVGEPLVEGEFQVFQREIRTNVSYLDALVCTQSAALIQTCEDQLRDFGYTIHPTTNMELAAKALGSKNFHVMILDQNFFKGEEGVNLLTRLKKTPLNIRRCQVIILVSPNISSCEPQIFYQWSLDMNIHPRDLEKLGEMLRSLVNLRARMLGPYLETPKLG